MPQLGALQLAESGRSATLTTPGGDQLNLYLGESFGEIAREFQILKRSITASYGIAQLSISYGESPGASSVHIYRFEWRCLSTTSLLHYLKVHRDTIHLEGVNTQKPFHWYGGPMMMNQKWPISTKQGFTPFAPYVVNDLFKQPISGQERYWLCSRKIVLQVPQHVPLWVQLDKSYLGLQAQRDDSPYESFGHATDPPVLEYQLAIEAKDNSLEMGLRSFHSECFKNYLRAPSGLPDRLMIKQPIWSTWAKFGRGIHQLEVEQYIADIMSNHLPISQIELDDTWTFAYGDFEVDARKFPDFKGMIASLSARGIRTTVWVYIRQECALLICRLDSLHNKVFKESKNAKDPRLKRFFLQCLVDGDLQPGETKWWNGQAFIIDFTHPVAAEWYTTELKRLKDELGIHAFKFDGGEVNFLPKNFRLRHGTEPNDYCRAYANLAASFGSAVETRLGSQTQGLPIFIRTFDRLSKWENAGLKTLIPSVLSVSLHGYFWCLPDMIGGNGVGEGEGRPDKELYIRWMQASTFLLAMQFSFAPFDYDEETVSICRQLIKLRESYSPYMLAQCELAVQQCAPVIRPLWWLCEDELALRSDDQFLVGDDLLVAPVLAKGETKRDVFFPEGVWKGGNDGCETYQGPGIFAIDAPLHVLPYFNRKVDVGTHVHES